MKKLAIIVPYRNREEHLAEFVPHMNKHLPDADIFVIEQADNRPFNRAKLLNVGVALTNGYDYYAMHDVDMLPEPEVDYSFPDKPTHLATACSQFDYKMPYAEYFGGVTLISRRDMLMADGYSNHFWGWGAEDDEFRNRLLFSGLELDSRPGRFTSLGHLRDVNWQLHAANVKRLRTGRPSVDGLSHCNFAIDSYYSGHGFKLYRVRI